MTTHLDISLELQKIDNGFIATGHVNDEEIKRFYGGAQDLMNRVGGEFSQLIDRLNRGERDWATEGNVTIKFLVDDERVRG